MDLYFSCLFGCGLVFDYIGLGCLVLAGVIVSVVIVCWLVLFAILFG